MIEGLMCHLDFFKNLKGQLKHENSHIITLFTQRK
jgi:hypothetical protein